MIKANKKAGLVALVLVLASISFLGWAKYKTSFVKATGKSAVVDSVATYKIDTAKVALLKRVYSKLNLNKSEFLITGSMSAKNGADTTDRLKNAQYVFSRKGTSFYFKMGATETFNANGIYLYVDHGMKKVLLAKEKQVVSGFAMPELSTVLKTVTEEGFRLNSTINGENERISFTNPDHLSCKEYSVTFNKQSLAPSKLYVRLSDGEEPENNKKDNVIDFRIQRSSTDSEIARYIAQNIVIKGNKSWSLGPAFKNYELINTL
ncbi:hypothetical protein [Pedobacter nyackensis]|uniref:hypothetical protein n=1 Tax=Pedobacter nyackensis TaxID=475255 RepID=UPI00292F51AE|nr:hypothetical protein [Pedobacter nyackensis]